MPRPRHRRRPNRLYLAFAIDHALTYDGISKNSLPFLDADTLPPEIGSLALAELYFEQWHVETTTEQLFLHVPIPVIADPKMTYHPLKWLFDLIKSGQLLVYCSSRECTLTLILPSSLPSVSKKQRFNVFAFFTRCTEDEQTKIFFKNLFTFDDYQPMSTMNEEETGGVNMIDFIYREIQAETMLNIDENDDIVRRKCSHWIQNDVIRMKQHQIQSIIWMLNREQSSTSNIAYTPLHRCRDLSDRLFYVHIVYGFPLNVQELHNWDHEQLSLSGGLLCDEMGLGKTMCVLLTSLLHKCPTSFLSSIDNESSLSSTGMKRSYESSSNDDSPPNKIVKVEPSQVASLTCICGKVVKIPKRNQHLAGTIASICSQCSRSIHNACYLQRNNDNEPFVCPYCEQRRTDADQPFSTGATLIIAPAAIIHQWSEEIDKHLVNSLNVFMYRGIINGFPVPNRRFLAQQDFIFCSYENLKKDIHHNEACLKEFHSRNTRRYEYLVSPLLRLKFWRLVLDEAQMVDSPNAPASKMARSVLSHHRWFVTGTPFHRSIADLEGIVQYLFPASSSIARDQVATLLRKKDKINDVFLSWMMNFLKPITRRTSRECLNDLPEQYERVIHLRFSSLERMYYDRIWSECRGEFTREFQHLWQKHERERNDGVIPQQQPTWTLASDGEIDMNDVHFLSATARSCLQTPLIKLRCLCDHPQVGAHGVRHNDPALVHFYNRYHHKTPNVGYFPRRIQRDLLPTAAPAAKDGQPFTMKDLLDLLTARELEGGEDSLRLALLNLNGLASVYLIQFEHEATRPVTENNNNNNLEQDASHYLDMAIRTYERVLETITLYKEHFHSDSFQQAHAYYNLAHYLSLRAKTIEQDSLPSVDEAMEQFDKIKTRHQTQSEFEMAEAWKNYNEKLLTKTEVDKEIETLLASIANYVKPLGQEKIDIHHHVNRERQLPFTSWSGFVFKLVQEFDRLKEIRTNLLTSIEALKRQPTDADVLKMGSCSNCGLENDPTMPDNKCIFCECDIIMKSYNCSLQPELYSDKQINEEDGTLLVYFINEVLTKASMRSHESTRQLAKLFRTDWSELLKKLRLENSAARTYSQQLKHLYLSLDEMLQCTSRLEMWTGDPKRRPKKVNNRFRFNPQTMQEERLDFEQNADDYLKQIIKYRQQFGYFQEQQQDYYRSIAVQSEQRTRCPMCHESFGDDRPDVCFFLCGHFFCRDCALQWKQHEVNLRPNRTHIKCPICRREIPIHSLTVLKWSDHRSTTKSIMESSSTDNMTSPRVRRLMETQEHLSIQGRYGTKVDSIVSFIINLLNDDTEEQQEQQPTTTTTMIVETKPPLKILVFSQFTDVLNVLAISLKLNAISHLQFTSTKILQQFRQDPTITVLLMPLGKGANGLNLTEAQHVILVEPQLHRSVELQAIARVRRLGQRHNTYVYRFIVDETAEEVVLANSRTAQTVSKTNNDVLAISNNETTASRAASFADFELFYEINMARKIFFKTQPSTNNDDESNLTTL